MTSKDLRNRENWQTTSELKAIRAEKRFYLVMQNIFKETVYAIRDKPRDFSNIYTEVNLDKETLNQIYTPDRSWKHGIVPDYAIDNTETGKTLYVEVKRQDGWVEGKKASAGRGNAHERSTKYYTPGLLKVMREKGKHDDKTLPFVIIFQGDITRDPKRVREITYWFQGYDNHFFMWRDTTDPNPLINHFTKLQSLLD